MAIVAVVTALAAPASAHSATATLSDARLSVEAFGGEANRITVAEDAGGYTVTDTVALSAGSGCTSVNSFMVRCATSAARRSVFVDVSDGDDRVVVKSLGSETASEVRAGDGNDRIFGGDANDVLDGGDGVDSLLGGAGFNTLDGGPGDDFLYGGAGRDRLTYAARRRSVRVDLAKDEGGQRGEHDTLDEIEEVVGGRRADDLRGTKGDDTLLGGPGRAWDRVLGRGGADVLVARRAAGGGGSDQIDSNAPTCGGGRDTIYRDRYLARGPYQRSCESVVAKFLILRARPLRASRQVAVFKVRCRRAKHCRGTLELRDADGRLGKKRFSLRRGKVRVRFNRPTTQRVARLRIRDSRGKRRSSFRVRLG